MATEADGDGAVSDAQLARRLQILATEHWGLLAARSTAQNEVLARITIYLTLVSAGLVTIGLLGQTTKFGSWFAVAALAILGFLSVVGLFTLARVLTASEEDMMYVVAMNRIRGAYAEVDRVAADAFLASTHDDEIGMAVTYSFLRYRGSLEQVLGSSAMLSLLVARLHPLAPQRRCAGELGTAVTSDAPRHGVGQALPSRAICRRYVRLEGWNPRAPTRSPPVTAACDVRAGFSLWACSPRWWLRDWPSTARCPTSRPPTSPATGSTPPPPTSRSWWSHPGSARSSSG